MILGEIARLQKNFLEKIFFLPTVSIFLGHVTGFQIIFFLGLVCFAHHECWLSIDSYLHVSISFFFWPSVYLWCNFPCLMPSVTCGYLLSVFAGYSLSIFVGYSWNIVVEYYLLYLQCLSLCNVICEIYNYIYLKYLINSFRDAWCRFLPGANLLHLWDAQYIWPGSQ